MDSHDYGFIVVFIICLLFIVTDVILDYLPKFLFGLAIFLGLISFVGVVAIASFEIKKEKPPENKM